MCVTQQGADHIIEELYYVIYHTQTWGQILYLVVFKYFNPLIPIDTYGCHKNFILFLGISRYPRALRSSANDSGHAQGRFEKMWPAFGAPTPLNCVVRQNIATHTTVFETFFMWACFWHSLKDFKVVVALPRCEIGSM